MKTIHNLNSQSKRKRRKKSKLTQISNIKERAEKAANNYQAQILLLKYVLGEDIANQLDDSVKELTMSLIEPYQELALVQNERLAAEIKSGTEAKAEIDRLNGVLDSVHELVTDGDRVPSQPAAMPEQLGIREGLVKVDEKVSEEPARLASNWCFGCQAYH